MLSNDNIISTSVSSEAFENILIGEKIIANAPLCVLLYTATAVTKSRPTYTNSRNSDLPTRIHPVQLNKSQKKTFRFL